MSDMNNNSNKHTDPSREPVRGDRLDQLLRSWHDQNEQSARAMRDELLAHAQHDAMLESAGGASRKPAQSSGILARIGVGRLVSAAAIVMLGFLLVTLFVKNTEKSAFATGGLMLVPEGGELVAMDNDGAIMGPCPLQHTDVAVEITGPFARTVVEQVYANPYTRTIEAVYTFPLSNRAAVDRMTMIVKGASGERVVEGEVKERALARAIYEDARESGYVASLLEQERPNIFTQSVANIEPGATVRIRIATIELVERKDGVSSYAFPMVVGPRYIPGSPASMPSLPDGFAVREGVVLRGPARVEPETGSALAMPRMTDILERGLPIRAAKNEIIDELLSSGDGVRFTAHYADGSGERGIYFPSRSIGEINGRFFYAPIGKDQGSGFASDTNQVPDASRITPMPTRPPERAGHDISVRVTIDSGATPLGAVTSELHNVSIASPSATQRTIALTDAKTIPNRDFILHWESKDDSIEPGFFAHVSDAVDTSLDTSARGGYFALMLEPPARVAPAVIRPRELIFVLDVSGSMNGFPIEKSKELARKAIAKMRPTDTFNIITFAGATSVLWPEPRLASDENRKAADDFVGGTYGAGGTEMMTAINTALVQPGRSGIAPAKLLDLPADGRGATVLVPSGTMTADGKRWKIAAGNAADGSARFITADISVALPENTRKLGVILDGSWTTLDADRVFVARSARFEDADARTRIVFFLTDAYVGNDQAIVQAVRDNARASRVFSFGIGNSVNRFLLEEIARAGRGTCDIVSLEADADAVVDRLVRHIDAPVLTDIELAIDPALGIHDMLPGGDHLPDLYDQQPIVLMGRFDHAASGSLTVRGRTGAGAWERTIRVDLPATEAKHDVVKTLWARAKVDDLLLPKLAAVESQSLDAPTKRAVIRLGEAFHIATPYTSFVAVEKSRVVLGGKPMLVNVPVELPDGLNWAGFFGEGVRPADALVAEVRGDAGREELRAGVETLEKKMETEWFGRPQDESVSLSLENNADGASFFGLSEAVGKPSAAAVATASAAPVTASAPAVTSTVSTSQPTSSNAGGDGQKPAGDPTLVPPGATATRESLGGVAGKRGLSADAAGALHRPGRILNSESKQQANSAVAPPPSNGPSGGFSGGLVGGGGGGFGGAASAPSNGAPPVAAGQGGSRDASKNEKDRGNRPHGSVGVKRSGASIGREKVSEELGRGLSGGDGGRPATGSAGVVLGDVPIVGAVFTESEGRDQSEAQNEQRRESAGAPAEVDPTKLNAQQRDRLVRVLERRLVFVALAAFLGEDALLPALLSDFALPVTGSDHAQLIRVVLKIRAGDKGLLDEKALTALRAIGVVIDGEDVQRGFVVADVAPTALTKAALIEGVLRIEPLEAKEAVASAR